MLVQVMEVSWKWVGLQGGVDQSGNRSGRDLALVRAQHVTCVLRQLHHMARQGNQRVFGSVCARYDFIASRWSFAFTLLA